MKEYLVPPAVLNVAYGNNGDYGSMPCRDETYRIPGEWLEANAKRFHFTDEQIINSAVTKFETPNLPPLAACYCVYFLISNKEIVYVGMSRELGTRMITHRKRGIVFDSFTWFEVPEVFQRDIESYYIHRIQPPFNTDYPIYTGYAKIASKFDTDFAASWR